MGFFKFFGQELLVNCNVHLSGGHAEKDHDLRAQQLELIQNKYTSLDPRTDYFLLSGDFNTPISEFISFSKDLDLEYIHNDHPTQYNTENRV